MSLNKMKRFVYRITDDICQLYCLQAPSFISFETSR